MGKRDSKYGYGRPPKHTRFKPGISGNPAGRPKGSINLRSVLEKALREKVLITEKGSRKSISKLEAAMKQLVNRSATGDLTALRTLVNIARAVLASPIETNNSEETQAFPEEEMTMEQVEKRLAEIEQLNESIARVEAKEAKGSK